VGRSAQIWLIGGLLTGCTSNVDEFSDVIKADKEVIVEAVAAQSQALTETYTYQDKEHTAEWLACKISSAEKTVLVINEGAEDLSPELCNGNVAQMFLGHSYDVLIFNPPGSGNSTGEDDFAGPHSLGALNATYKKALAQAKLPALGGVWAVNEGTILASFFAKNQPSLEWVILGAGIYDLERAKRETTDVSLKQRITQIENAEGEDGLAARSIAWDYVGLPKRVYLYHGKDDKVVPIDNVNAFKDTLSTGEYSAEILFLEKKGHKLSEDDHAKVLANILGEKK
jgi:pimeloyl-ACP methyl ester carboxylesterase